MRNIVKSDVNQALDVRVGGSTKQEIYEAVDEFVDQVLQPDLALVVVFVSPVYDLDVLGPLLNKRIDSCPVIGCSTAGEITPQGYSENSITGFSLSGKNTSVKTFTIDCLHNLKPESIQEISHATLEHFTSQHNADSDLQSFALFFMDGMSGLEEQVVALIHQVLGNIPLVGGSAGDSLSFKQTWVLGDKGKFMSDTAVCAIISTSLPFETFKTQHFLPTDTKLVITDADPSTRTVKEINGMPAVEEYARLIGIEPDALVPEVFSRYPIMLKIGTEYFVRSLQKKNSDGSLIFYCAIDNGLVLTVGKGVDMLKNLEETLADVCTRIVRPQLLVSCECVLRRLEVEQRGLTQDMNRILRKHHAIGFHSYGEQFNSVHVNQTFSGVLIGSKI